MVRRENRQLNRLEFHISYGCQNSCVFCSERDQLDKYGSFFVPLGQITKQISNKKRLGLTHLTLTGGEPTLHPDFFEILKKAKSSGFKTYASSNGGRFFEEKFCRQALPFLDEICFSLHGHTPESHNFHTKNPMSFALLMKALENVGKFGKNNFIFFNIVATRYNFESLEEIMSLAIHLGAKQILISNLAPEGNGLKNFRDLSVPLDKFSKKIPALTALAKNKKIAVRFFGLPLCVLGKDGVSSNDLWWSPRLTIEKKGGGLKETLSLCPTRKRMKPVKCSTCAAKKLCGGVFEKYYREFGDKHLKPFVK